MAQLNIMTHAYLQSLGLPMQPVAAAVLAHRSRRCSAPSVLDRLPDSSASPISELPLAPDVAAPVPPKPSKGDVKISKLMTDALRHNAVKLSLSLRPDGYVPVSELLTLSDFQKAQADVEGLRRIVAGSDKQRFSLATLDGQLQVRANQGHSQALMEVIREDQLLEQVLPGHEPEICVHGTQMKFWPSILKKGLLAGSRMHVHFAPRLPPREAGDKEVVSGMRQVSDCIVFLDLPRALKAGLPVYKSSNEVFLTPGFEGVVPASLFLKAVRRDDLSLIWTNEDAPSSA